jgi:AcrR family transcriptional regulator
VPRALTERADALPALAEAFRAHGYEGASLSVLSEATGLGKGSLYNFFPGGKAEMMDAVLAEVDAWFSRAVFEPLERDGGAADAITAMFRDVDGYFASGGRVCLVGLLGLGGSRDPFAARLRGYFERWIHALASCLRRGGVTATDAQALAEEAVAGIQGGIVLARALGDQGAFGRVLRRLERQLLLALDRA